ncbi:MAG: peptidylprolyl isomerase [Williamsia sp.]|nr:peptidylprolyl isomerase [Williamsia sp.]
MKHFLLLPLFLMLMFFLQAQKLTVAQMKAGMEKAPNPVAYVRQVLKKNYKIDSISIVNTTRFLSLADSIAYTGKLGKVYGPVENKYLIQVLGKAPNQFNRISQIFIDTSTFTFRIADSLANSIVQRIKDGTASFEDMASTYSMGGESSTQGDVGWMARGFLVPEIERELPKHKKGEVFKVWSRTGVHILKKTADPKQDAGFVLLLRVIL